MQSQNLLFIPHPLHTPIHTSDVFLEIVCIVAHFGELFKTSAHGSNCFPGSCNSILLKPFLAHVLYLPHVFGTSLGALLHCFLMHM